MLSEIDVLTPHSVEEALGLLHENQGDVKIIAGGSDVIVQLKDGVIKTKKLLNILSLKDLRYIKNVDKQVRIGSLATYSDIIETSLTQQYAPILVTAAKQIGAAQLQNTATIGGNLGNASPAADSVPPLYALDARIVTLGKSGRRDIPIEDFFIGYRKTALRPDELIEEIYFDGMDEKDRGAYLKLGLRNANAISIVDIAVVLRERNHDGSFADARVALGAVTPTVKRARKCENLLVGKPLNADALWDAAPLAAEEASPITDIRASAEYRRDVVGPLVYQTLYEAVYGS